MGSISWRAVYSRSVTDPGIYQSVPWPCVLCIGSKSQCFRSLGRVSYFIMVHSVLFFSRGLVLMTLP